MDPANTQMSQSSASTGPPDLLGPVAQATADLNTIQSYINGLTDRSLAIVVLNELTNTYVQTLSNTNIGYFEKRQHMCTEQPQSIPTQQFNTSYWVETGSEGPRIIVGYSYKEDSGSICYILITAEVLVNASASPRETQQLAGPDTKKHNCFSDVSVYKLGIPGGLPLSTNTEIWDTLESRMVPAGSAQSKTEHGITAAWNMGDSYNSILEVTLTNAT